MNNNQQIPPIYFITGSVNTYISGFPITNSFPKGKPSIMVSSLPGEHGSTKYFYSSEIEEDEILNKIEKEKLIILDESEEDNEEMPRWYEVIDQKTLEENINKPATISNHLNINVKDSIIKSLPIIQTPNLKQKKSLWKKFINLIFP